MSKEIYISSTPHETRLAIVEDEALAEIYYERENEYTLAGSIYNGRVTRVLPGMQSSFVDIGLERDAFLYITDFLEEAADPEEFDTSAPRQGGDRNVDRGARGKRSGRERYPQNAATEPTVGPELGGRQDSRHNDAGLEQDESADSGSATEIGEGAPGADGSRRWRGRRGRRRGRGGPAGDAARSGTVNGISDAPEVQTGSALDDLETASETGAADQQNRFGERQGRDDQERGRRPGRGPRGFSPSRGELYGIRGEEARGTGPVENAYGDIYAGNSPEPIILPGESLSKYRKAGDEPEPSTPPPSGSSTLASPSLTSLAPPATLYTQIATGWDGGSVLPGETLSRRRAPETSRPVIERSAERQGDARPIELAATDLSEESVGASQAAEVQTAPSTGGTPVPESHELEYEPETASASFRVDPVPPREFRNAPIVESPADFEDDLAAEPAAEAVETPAETSTSPEGAEPLVHDITSISPTGEMISEPELIVDEVATSGSVFVEDETSPIHHEHAVVSVEATEPEESVWSAESSSEDEALQAQDEEPAATTLQASSIEEIDDEEETLEGAADLGVMLREMSIDQITRSDSEQDDLEEETLEEYDTPRDYVVTREEGATEQGFQTASGDDEYDYPEQGDEEEEVRTADAVAEEPAPQRRDSDRRGRRDRRDGRRGRGDRPGHGNGRSRHSVQATNLPAISDLLKPGQEILVQIAKEPIAKKGARITSHIALPGRFLVFMPTVNHTGVSRKIESDAERRRLKEILLSEKGEASGGFIVRTAAEGASEDELRSDLRFLLNLWSDIKARSESSKSPALIYHDLNLIERILRDQVTDNFSAIWVDSETEYERVLRFLQRFQPSLIRRVKLYSKETPLFEQFGISDEINKALKSKVWLKSGGSIVINQTEALVAIDINTGKFVGKTARLEDTIVKTNLDAIPEIVRQIRLRDLGGIIIIDFIDMDERKNRNRVMAALEDELKKDRAPSKVLQFNDFGLVAITRKRVKQSLERTLSVPCSVCSGTGMVKSPVTVCNDIYIEMRKMQRHLDRGDVMLRVHPEVVKQLKASGAKWLQEMEEMVGKTILVKSDPSLHPEQFDIH